MDRQRAEGDSRDDIDDYAWVTARFGYSGLAKGLELAVTVNNLTDDDNARYPFFRKKIANSCYPIRAQILHVAPIPNLSTALSIHS